MTPTGVSRLFESLTRIEMLSEISLPSHVILTPVDVIDGTGESLGPITIGSSHI